jgi:hypothetical protein
MTTLLGWLLIVFLVLLEPVGLWIARHIARKKGWHEFDLLDHGRIGRNWGDLPDY